MQLSVASQFTCSVDVNEQPSLVMSSMILLERSIFSNPSYIDDCKVFSVHSTSQQALLIYTGHL